VTVIRFGPFEADLQSQELKKLGVPLRLTGQSFQILKILLENPGVLVRREQLHQTLWPSDTFVDFEHGLNAAVNRVREALGDDANDPRFIETLPRRGYRFVGPIELPSTAQHLLSEASSSAQSVPRWRHLRLAVYGAVGLLALLAILVGVKAYGWRSRFSLYSAPPRIESLAVLPLADLSHDPEQGYFADGMTEALIANLAQVKSLRVISRTTAMHYKATNETLPQIARELNVDGVIEGTVQRSGNRIRVTAKLIRGQSETPLWAKVYERGLQDVLVMQNELAQAIVKEIKVNLTPQERRRLAEARPINPEAYDAYLLGNFHAAKRNPAAIEKAIDYFQKAVRIDANYAQAYVGLANAYEERDFWGATGLGPSAERVRANTLRALELDDDLAEAHELLGWIYFRYDWNWLAAESEFKRAIELNANLPSAYQQYAYYLLVMGRHEDAIATVHHAVELDPLSPWYVCEEGRVLHRARRYEEAVTRYQRALELDPSFLPAILRIIQAYEQLGNYDAALTYVQKSRELLGDTRASLLASVRLYALMGRHSEALEFLNTLEKNGALENDMAGLAAAYVALNNPDRAITVFHKGFEERSIMPFNFVDPELDPIRSDPRFLALLRKARLPD
jgi:TolB-like protein/DNA-binding winged helix-turn-helix (wHTH) protein/Tfp pilus assembly protein PilF